MILIDFTQTIIAGLMAQLKMNGGEVSEDMLRHMILNSVRNYQKKYAREYGEIVLCTDASHTWRKDFYPLYKANRKKTRDASDMDWGMLFDTLQKVKEEIRDNFPYRYMYVEKCEADDIIAILVKHATEPVLIVSGDKDFQQLHHYDVKQWSPNLNKMIRCEDPSMFLKEHILRGDKSDGIPNILSNDDCFDLGIRQTPLRKPVLEKYLRISIEKDDKYYRNYLRNQTLIDLDLIPDHIEESILSEFDKTTIVKGKVFNYLVSHRLNELLNHVEDFTL
jgi:5'-3' exonuclease